jgi:TolB-like protein/Flp pilus assembly protein TadD
MNFQNFLAELRRRNIYRVAVAYAFVAWLLIQITTQVFPFFDIPNSFVRFVIFLLMLAFPVVLVLSWVFEFTPEGLKRTEEVPPHESITHHTGRLLTAITVVVAFLAASLLVLRHALSDSAKAPALAAPISEKSIAVLPFENLSEEKASAFFASGIHDEVLIALAKIGGLKVISRSSTALYQNSSQDLTEIARALGVAHILKGSVQKSGKRLRVNVQLIHPASDVHLWGESYDRGVEEIFAVEAEIARNVANALRLALSTDEVTRVERKPTRNGNAYILYLRARAYQTSASGLLGDYVNAARLYTEAIELDPKFALARARLSACLSYIHQEFQPTAENRVRALAEAEEALRLRPDAGEAHLARALCYYWLDKNYEGALRELALASLFLPNDSDVDATIAYISRRRGQWSEAHRRLVQVFARDPANAQIAEELSFTDLHLRDWDAARRWGDRAVELAPDSPIVTIYRRYLEFWSQGNLAPLNASLAAIPESNDPDGVVTLARWDSAMIERDFTAAEKAVAACRVDSVQIFMGAPLPKSYLLGSIALARGETEKARALFDIARPTLEAEVGSHPGDSIRRAYLGMLYTYLGRREDALREGRGAVELLREAQDAADGPFPAALLALILARNGAADEALALIERLLATPGPVDLFEASITVPDLRLRWQWDPLRNNPRFQKIVAGPEPKTIYK